MTSSEHVSPDAFNANCSRSVKDSKILLSNDNGSSDINNIEKSSSNLQNQNPAESRHKPCYETDSLSDQCKFATRTTSTPGPSSPVTLNIPECPNQPVIYTYSHVESKLFNCYIWSKNNHQILSLSMEKSTHDTQ